MTVAKNTVENSEKKTIARFAGAFRILEFDNSFEILQSDVSNRDRTQAMVTQRHNSIRHRSLCMCLKIPTRGCTTTRIFSCKYTHVFVTCRQNGPTYGHSGFPTVRNEQRVLGGNNGYPGLSPRNTFLVRHELRDIYCAITTAGIFLSFRCTHTFAYTPPAD